MLEIHKISLLDTMNELQQDRIKELIVAESHQLRFFVHPFFNVYKYGIPALYSSLAKKPIRDNDSIDTWVESYFLPQPNKQLDLIRKKRMKEYLIMLCEWLKSCPHAIIGVAEEDLRVDTTVKILRTQGFEGKIGYYPTLKSTPLPAYADHDLVAKRLIDLEVHTVAFGGQMATYPETSTNQDSSVTTEQLFDANNMKSYMKQLGNWCVAHFVQGLVEGVQTEMISQHLSVPPIHTLVPMRIMSQ